VIKGKRNEIKTWHFLPSSMRFNIVKLSGKEKEEYSFFATAK